MRMNSFFVLGAGVLLLVTLMTIGACLYIFRFTSNTAQSMGDAVEGVFASEELASELRSHNRHYLLYYLRSEKDQLDAATQSRTKVYEWYKRMQNAVSDQEEGQLVTELKSLIDDYFNQFDSLRENHKNPVAIYLISTGTLNTLDSKLDRLSNINALQADGMREAIEKRGYWIRIVSVAILIAVSMVFLIFFVSLWKFFVKPVRKLHRSILSFGQGELSTRAQPEGFFEFRNIFKAFNEMAEGLDVLHHNQMRYLASVSHDIRNPLGAIQMASEILTKTESEQSSNQAGLLTIIKRQAKHLEALTGDLLEVAKIQAGKLKLIKTRMDIRKCLHDSAALYESTSSRHEIVLITPDHSITCEIDSDRIQQVLNNLIGNAIKYSPQGGQVLLRLEENQTHAIVSIEDSGVGIPEEDLEKVFEPFRRSKSTIHGIPGTGLGLFSAKKILEAHGAEIHIASVVNKGTRVTVIIPLAEANYSEISRPS